MHQKVVSVRTCPVSDKVSFEPVSDGLLVRVIFLKPKFKDHKVASSKPVLVDIPFFFVDFPVSGVVRAKPQKVKLWCNVKLPDGMPPRPSQWNFLLEH